jgi:dethiobiotin synthetase
VSPPLRGWFVTGTDTGVGKTVVSAVLCRTRREAGAQVVYVKPVQSGAADGDDDASDVASLADVPTVVGPVIGPSLAPGVAVRLAGEPLLREELVGVVRHAAAEYPDHELVVEGAGGLLVELGSDGTSVADLAAALGLPLVVVARPGLGTLNHTLLTLEAVERRGLPLAGVVVSGYPAVPDLAARTNLGELQRLTGGRLVGVCPHLALSGDDPLGDAPGYLAPTLGGGWDRVVDAPARP